MHKRSAAATRNGVEKPLERSRSSSRTRVARSSYELGMPCPHWSRTPLSCILARLADAALPCSAAILADAHKVLHDPLQPSSSAHGLKYARLAVARRPTRRARCQRCTLQRTQLPQHGWCGCSATLSSASCTKSGAQQRMSTRPVWPGWCPGTHLSTACAAAPGLASPSFCKTALHLACTPGCRPALPCARCAQPLHRPAPSHCTVSWRLPGAVLGLWQRGSGPEE